MAAPRTDLGVGRAYLPELGENPSADSLFVANLPSFPRIGYSRSVGNPLGKAGRKELKRHGNPPEPHYREPAAAAAERSRRERYPDGSGHRRHRRGLLRQAALPRPLAKRGASDRSADGCARRVVLLLRRMLALLPFGAAVGEDAVSSPEEVLSYWLPDYPMTSATPIRRRVGARRSGGWREAPS